MAGKQEKRKVQLKSNHKLKYLDQSTVMKARHTQHHPAEGPYYAPDNWTPEGAGAEGEGARAEGEGAGAEGEDESKKDSDVVVGIRVKLPDGTDDMRKIVLHAKPETLVSSIIKGANATIKKEGLELEVTGLVPLWTPAWDEFIKDKEMCSQLHKSKNSQGDWLSG